MRRLTHISFAASMLIALSAPVLLRGAGAAGAAGTPTPLPLQEFVSDHANSRVWNSYDQSVNASGPAYQGTAGAMVNPPDGVVYVLVRSAGNDLVAYESNHANGRVWNTYDLTTTAGGGTSAGGTPQVLYDPGAKLIHVYVAGTDHHLYEYVDDNLGGHLWNAYDHTLDAGNGGWALGTPSAVYDAADARIHIFVEGYSGHLTEYIADHANGHIWNAYDHTVDAGGGSSVNGSPGAVYDTGDSLIHIFVASSSNDLVEYIADHANGHVWNAYDHTVDAGGGGAVAGIPDPLYDPAGHLLHVFVANPGSHLVEYLADHANGHVWSAYDHTLDAGGGGWIVGSPSGVLTGGLFHVFARNPIDDLVEYVDDSAGGHVWNSYDHSAVSGGTTIGSDPAAIATSNGQIHAYAGGPLAPGGPARTGVGVYGFASWSAASQAITEGWPILGDTGGLGTAGPPYTSELSAKPDRNVGSAITATRIRVTWLSFWTVSGPAQGQASCGGTAPVTSDTWYSAAYQGGQTAARAIYQDFLASGAKPDYVILDPEGCNYGGGGPPSTAAWDQFIQGWADGVVSIDSSLHPGFYANQSEYHANSLASVNLPAFIAVSPILFSDGSGNRPFDSANPFGPPGNNVTGYIEYGDFNANPPQPNCPAAPYENAILNWGAPYNTLQFPDSGVDCGP